VVIQSDVKQGSFFRVAKVFRAFSGTTSSDTSFVNSPQSGDVSYLHYVTYQSAGGDEITVKSETEFSLDTLDVSECSYTLHWIQKDDYDEWFDPGNNPYTGHIAMEWEREETRRPQRSTGDVKNNAVGMDIAVYLSGSTVLPESEEQGGGRGMLVPLNDDHDAGQTQMDWEIETYTPDENNLRHITVKLSPEILTQAQAGQAFANAQLLLSVEGSSSEKVKVWREQDKAPGTRLIPNDGGRIKSWDLSVQTDRDELEDLRRNGLWVEGCISSSGSPRDWRLELSMIEFFWIGSGVVPIAIPGDVVDGTIVDVEDVFVLDHEDNKTHEIRSILHPEGKEHFVTVQGEGDVVLQATITPDAQEIRNVMNWETENSAVMLISPAVATDRRTVKFSRATGGGEKVPIDINFDGVECWEGVSWVVWCVVDGSLSKPMEVRPAGVPTPDGSRPPGTFIEATWDFVAEINPRAIIIDQDRPDLTGFPAYPPPPPHGPNITHGWPIYNLPKKNCGARDVAPGTFMKLLLSSRTFL